MTNATFLDLLVGTQGEFVCATYRPAQAVHDEQDRDHSPRNDLTVQDCLTTIIAAGVDGGAFTAVEEHVRLVLPVGE